MTQEQRLVQLAQRIRDEFNTWKARIGAANGIATLGADGILTASQRPAGGGGGGGTPISSLPAKCLLIGVSGSQAGAILPMDISTGQFSRLFPIAGTALNGNSPLIALKASSKEFFFTASVSGNDFYPVLDNQLNHKKFFRDGTGQFRTAGATIVYDPISDAVFTCDTGIIGKMSFSSGSVSVVSGLGAVGNNGFAVGNGTIAVPTSSNTVIILKSATMSVLHTTSNSFSPFIGRILYNPLRAEYIVRGSTNNLTTINETTYAQASLPSAFNWIEYNDGKIYGNSAGQVQEYDASDYTLIRTFTGSTAGVPAHQAVFGDGKMFAAVVGSQTGIEIYDLASGSLIQYVPLPTLSSTKFSQMVYFEP